MTDPNLFPNQPTPQEHVKKQSAQEEAYANVSKNVTALGSRLRMIEEQYANIRSKSQLIDGNLLEFEKNANEDIKSISEDVLEIKGVLQELREKIQLVSNEINSSVKEHDLKVLEKYIDFWNPGRFVTRDQLQAEIDARK